MAHLTNSPPPFPTLILFSLILLKLPAHAQFISHQSFHLPDFNATVVSDGAYGACSLNLFKVSPPVYTRVFTHQRGTVFPQTLSGNALIVDIGGRRVLVETGYGLNNNQFGGGHLLASMAQAGLSPESIDAVILTHVHSDHFHGLVTTIADSNGESVTTPTFPNAHVYIPRLDHDYWSNAPKKSETDALPQHILDGWSKAYIHTLQHLPENTVTFVEYEDGEDEDTSSSHLLPGITMLHAPGHTVGHSVVVFQRESSRLMAAGDLWHYHALQIVEDVNTGIIFDTNSTLAVASRRKIFDGLVEAEEGQGTLVLGFHEDFPGIGYIRRKEESGFDWVKANVGDLQPNPLVCAVDGSESGAA